ncbi:MAG: hypothetical protein LAT82_04680 [Nanoarchaeota archaeon]|nr:hypothetical protein [Nanoarchaeota archaeon]
MANISLSIPDTTYKKMKQFPEIRWSEVSRQAITKKIESLEELNKNSNQYTAQEIESFFTIAAEDIEDYLSSQSEVVLKDE